MAQNGAEPLGAMGSDTPIAVLSERPRLLFDYFTQQFAQVTNPPLDSIREEVVTSMKLGLGPERNLLDGDPEHATQVVLDFPVIDNDELAKIQHIDPRAGQPHDDDASGASTASTTGPTRMEKRLAADVRRGRRGDRGRRAVHRAVSDRDSNKDLAPIPSLLMLAGGAPPPHPHTRTGMKVGLIVEAGDVREVHHVALLIGLRRIGDQPVPRDGDAPKSSCAAA